MKNFFKKGFTLIELLIVIAIIGILSGIIVTNVQGVRQRARDARRKSDLDAIAQSLRLYYNDKQQYPTATGGAINGCGPSGTSTCAWGSDAFQASTTVYMNRLPLDPSSPSTGTQIKYTYANSSPDSFTLTATMENISDPDIANSQTRCGGTTSSTTYYVCP